MDYRQLDYCGDPKKAGTLNNPALSGQAERGAFQLNMHPATASRHFWRNSRVEMILNLEAKKKG